MTRMDSNAYKLLTLREEFQNMLAFGIYQVDKNDTTKIVLPVLVKKLSSL